LFVSLSLSLSVCLQQNKRIQQQQQLIKTNDSLQLTNRSRAKFISVWILPLTASDRNVNPQLCPLDLHEFCILSSENSPAQENPFLRCTLGISSPNSIPPCCCRRRQWPPMRRMRPFMSMQVGENSRENKFQSNPIRNPIPISEGFRDVMFSRRINLMQMPNS